MKVLILDTSSDYLFVSIVIDGIEAFKKVSEGRHSHSDNLMNTIIEGMDSLKLTVSNLDRIIVGIGPGAYTGLRVSLTIAKMFAWTKDVPLYCVSSLDILSSGYMTKDGLYAVTLVAKKDYVYYKIIEIKDSNVIIKVSDAFSSFEEFRTNYLTDNMILINKDNYDFNGVNISKMELQKVKDIHSLVPNYLREGI